MTDDGRVPGRRLRVFAERTFDPQTLETIILPALADLQHECSGAPSALRRRWIISLRAYWGIWKTIGWCLVGDAVRDRDGMTASLGRRVILFLPIIITVLMLPTAWWLVGFASKHGARSALTAGMFLVPASAVIALPVAFFFAVAMYRSRADRPSTRLLPSAIAGSVACAAVVFALLMAAVATSNQAFRTLVFHAFQSGVTNGPGDPVRKGLPEMTWPELNEHIRHAPSIRQAELARAHLQQRVCVCRVGVRTGAARTRRRRPLAIARGDVRRRTCASGAVRRLFRPRRRADERRVCVHLRNLGRQRSLLGRCPAPASLAQARVAILGVTMTDRDRVPGAWLRRFAERTFDRETLDRVILLALADLQHECGAAPGTTLRLAFGLLALGIANRRSRMSTFGWGLWVLALYVVVLRAASPTRGPSVEALYVVNAAFAIAGLMMIWSRPKFGDYELRSRA